MWTDPHKVGTFFDLPHRQHYDRTGSHLLYSGMTGLGLLGGINKPRGSIFWNFFTPLPLENHVVSGCSVAAWLYWVSTALLAGMTGSGLTCVVTWHDLIESHLWYRGMIGLGLTLTYSTARLDQIESHLWCCGIKVLGLTCSSATLNLTEFGLCGTTDQI